MHLDFHLSAEILKVVNGNVWSVHLLECDNSPSRVFSSTAFFRNSNTLLIRMINDFELVCIKAEPRYMLGLHSQIASEHSSGDTNLDCMRHVTNQKYILVILRA